METAGSNPWRGVWVAVLFGAVVPGAIVIGSLVFGGEEDGEKAPVVAPSEGDDVLARAASFYEARDVFERPHPYTPVPKGLPNMQAETCGACHQEIYKEWAVSTHRRAWLDDAQFQKELEKSRGAHAEPGQHADDVSWLCVNCHTPLVNQLPQVVVGLEDGDIGKPIYADNPEFDEGLQEDAITCATCHVREGVVHGPYGDGSAAPHPVAKGEWLLSEENCVRCHQAERVYTEKTLGCFFSTGAEWQESEHAKQGKICQDCHMPVVERKIAEAFDVPVRKTRRHWFGGSLIPKKPKFAAEVEPLRPVYGSGVTIELVALEGAPDPKGPCAQTPGACVRVAARVENARAGHHFPAGDPERHADVKVVAKRGGEVVGEASYQYGTKYKWWPEIERLTDTRLASGERHEVVLEVPRGDGELEVVVEADKWRMYAEAFDYHELEGEYVRGRRFHTSRWTVGVDGAVSLVQVTDDHGTRETIAIPE